MLLMDFNFKFLKCYFIDVVVLVINELQIKKKKCNEKLMYNNLVIPPQSLAWGNNLILICRNYQFI